MSDDLANLVACAWCGATIDLRKKHQRPGKYQYSFCNREHCTLWRKEHDFFKRMAEIGNKSQAVFKGQHGQIPQYEKRKEAVAASNREKPRRKKLS